VRRLIALIGFGALASLGCGDLGVGDPCVPQRPLEDGGMRGVCNPSGMQTNGCFRGTEIYIETQSLQCRSRICIVYKYDEASDALGSNRAKRVFCTCRCGVPATLRATTDASVLCRCPENFVCQTDVAGPQYDPGIQGSYCIRAGTAN